MRCIILFKTEGGRRRRLHLDDRQFLCRSFSPGVEFLGGHLTSGNFNFTPSKIRSRPESGGMGEARAILVESLEGLDRKRPPAGTP